MIGLLANVVCDLIERDIPHHIAQREKADEIIGFIQHEQWKAKQIVYRLRGLRRKKCTLM